MYISPRASCQKANNISLIKKYLPFKIKLSQFPNAMLNDQVSLKQPRVHSCTLRGYDALIIYFKKIVSSFLATGDEATSLGK